MHTPWPAMRWFTVQPELTMLAVAPLFHVTGMQGGMNGPLYNGNTVVLLPRWDRGRGRAVRAALPNCELDRGADHDSGFFS
jgi:acyl-coenzyme A synthetase/AMP-(fatty) acid ligase